MEYYLMVAGQTYGPHTDDQIVEMLSLGTLASDTLIWCEGMSEWQNISERFVQNTNSINPSTKNDQNFKKVEKIGWTSRRVSICVCAVSILAFSGWYLTKRHNGSTNKRNHATISEAHEGDNTSNEKVNMHLVADPTADKYKNALFGVSKGSIIYEDYLHDRMVIKNQLGQELSLSYVYLPNKNRDMIFDMSSPGSVAISDFGNNPSDGNKERSEACRAVTIQALNKFIEWTIAAYKNKLGNVVKDLPDDVQFPPPGGGYQFRWKYAFVADTSMGKYELRLVGDEPLWVVDYDSVSLYQYLFLHWDELKASFEQNEPVHKEHEAQLQSETERKFLEEQRKIQEKRALDPVNKVLK